MKESGCYGSKPLSFFVCSTSSLSGLSAILCAALFSFAGTSRANKEGENQSLSVKRESIFARADLTKKSARIERGSVPL